MEKAPDRRAVVVCDTTVLINFLVVERLDLIIQSPDYRFVVTEHAVGEVTDADQLGRLRAALESGGIEQIDLVEPAGLSIFAEISSFLGGGEAAAIALAAQRAWRIATDDGTARREVESRLGRGRLLTTPGILLRAIRNGTLTAKQADGIKAELETHRFKMSFASFADLL